MRLTAIFESWHIGDGNYPPLDVGQLVNLSFEIQVSELSVSSNAEATRLDSLDFGEYRFVARVIRVYCDLAVLEAGPLRFYTEDPRARGVTAGSFIQGRGTLELDHFAWVENVDEYPDPPDLFYKLRVMRIRKASIPERFVARHAKGKSYPSQVPLTELRPDEIEDLETMDGQRFDEEFYVVDFDDTDLEDVSIPRTFC